MNIKSATTHPLATQEIDGMIDMISTLIEKGYAYAVMERFIIVPVNSLSMEAFP